MTEDLEAQIAAHLATGDHAAAARAALQGYGPELLLYLRGVLQDDDAADEVFAQFSEKLWSGLPGYRARASFRTWAHRIAGNAALDHLRGAWRRRVRRLATVEGEQLARPSASLPQSRARRSSLDRLKQALSPAERALLLLRVEQGLPWRDVAEALSLPEPAVRKRFERLKRRLRLLAAQPR